MAKPPLLHAQRRVGLKSSDAGKILRLWHL